MTDLVGTDDVVAEAMHPYYCVKCGHQLHEKGLGILGCARCGTEFLPTVDDAMKWEKEHPGEQMMKVSWIENVVTPISRCVCGKEPVINTFKDEGRFSVACMNTECSAEQPCVEHNTLAKAVRDWNEHIEHLTNPLLICGRCYETVEELFPANCNEKPEKLAGQPIGQYHCPDCGAMVVAGVPHPDLCKRCIDREHPGFDVDCGACMHHDTTCIGDRKKNGQCAGFQADPEEPEEVEFRGTDD